MNAVLILITTESNENLARNIANLLIQNNLAACVSIKSINSIYKWNDQIEEAFEFEITIKSRPELKDDLILFLQKMTSYDVPQILYRTFYSEAKYHDWLTKVI